MIYIEEFDSCQITQCLRLTKRRGRGARMCGRGGRGGCEQAISAATHRRTRGATLTVGTADRHHLAVVTDSLGKKKTNMVTREEFNRFQERANLILYRLPSWHLFVRPSYLIMGIPILARQHLQYSIRLLEPRLQRNSQVKIHVSWQEFSKLQLPANQEPY